MQTFEPGDVMVYEHVIGGNVRRNGSCGIVLTHVNDGAVRVNWLLKSAQELDCNYWIQTGNLWKLGHVDAQL